MDGYILTPIGVIVIATYSFLIFLNLTDRKSVV